MLVSSNPCAFLVVVVDSASEIRGHPPLVDWQPPGTPYLEKRLPDVRVCHGHAVALVVFGF